MVSNPRILRRTQDLVDALQKHLKLLEEFSRKAFVENDGDYLGEVAGKLRVLVYEKGRNKPLLLALIDDFHLDIKITIDRLSAKPPPGQPSSGDKVSVRQFLDLPAYGVQTPTSGFVMLSKRELIGVWAQQNGAAHEDWAWDEPYSVASAFGFFIGGDHALELELRITSEAIINAGKRCLCLIDPKLYELKDAERVFKKKPTEPDAKNYLGVALGRLGEHDKALTQFDSVTRDFPDHLKAHNNKGLALLRLGRLREAANAFQRAIDLDADYAEAHYNLACVYSCQAKFGESLDHLGKVKALDGFRGINPLEDSDLVALRSNPEFGDRLMELLGS